MQKGERLQGQRFSIFNAGSTALLENYNFGGNLAPNFLKLHRSKDLVEPSRSLHFQPLAPRPPGVPSGMAPQGRNFFKTPFFQKVIKIYQIRRNAP